MNIIDEGLMTVFFSNMIFIAGAGRNVGKTTLGCRIIERISENELVTAIKVSAHHHKITELQKVIFQQEGITIYEELDKNSSKDSARYLRAGAVRSLFVQVHDNALAELVKWINKNVEGWIVCESGTLGKYIQPLKAIFVDSTKPFKKPNWDFEFQTTRFENEQFKPGLDLLFKDVIKKIEG